MHPAEQRLNDAEEYLYSVFRHSIDNLIERVVAENHLPTVAQADITLTAADRVTRVRLRHILDWWRKEMDAAVIPRMLRLFRDSAKRSLDRVVPDAPPVMWENIRDTRSNRWVAEIRKPLLGIGETIQREALEALQVSMDLGESPEKAAARVRLALDVSEDRARTIARTESAQALNAADWTVGQELQQAGIAHEREWIATMRGPSARRTRPAHREAHGQRVGMGEPFIVGGVPLWYPGDPAGPPDLIINCRCVSNTIPVNETPAEVRKSVEDYALVASFEEKLHPRGLDGRFIDVSLIRGRKWLQIVNNKNGETTWVPFGKEQQIKDYLSGNLPADRVKPGRKWTQILQEDGSKPIWIGKDQIDILKALDRDGHFDAKPNVPGPEPVNVPEPVKPDVPEPTFDLSQPVDASSMSKAPAGTKLRMSYPGLDGTLTKNEDGKWYTGPNGDGGIGRTSEGLLTSFERTKERFGDQASLSFESAPEPVKPNVPEPVKPDVPEPAPTLPSPGVTADELDAAKPGDTISMSYPGRDNVFTKGEDGQWRVGDFDRQGRDGAGLLRTFAGLQEKHGADVRMGEIKSAGSKPDVPEPVKPDVPEPVKPDVPEPVKPDVVHSIAELNKVPRDHDLFSDEGMTKPISRAMAEMRADMGRGVWHKQRVAEVKPEPAPVNFNRVFDGHQLDVDALDRSFADAINKHLEGSGFKVQSREAVSDRFGVHIGYNLIGPDGSGTRMNWIFDRDQDGNVTADSLGRPIGLSTPAFRDLQDALAPWYEKNHVKDITRRPGEAIHKPFTPAPKPIQETPEIPVGGTNFDRVFAGDAVETQHALDSITGRVNTAWAKSGYTLKPIGNGGTNSFHNFRFEVMDKDGLSRGQMSFAFQPDGRGGVSLSTSGGTSMGTDLRLQLNRALKPWYLDSGITTQPPRSITAPPAPPAKPLDLSKLPKINEELMANAAKRGVDTDELIRKATNPDYYTNRQYQVNCQRVVYAYELRRRGYDVSAKPKPKARAASGDWNTWMDGLPERRKEGGRFLVSDAKYAEMQKDNDPRLDQVITNSEDYISSVVKNWKVGDRGYIEFYRNQTNGHILNVEMTPDGPKVIEAQSPAKENETVANIARQVRTSRMSGGRMNFSGDGDILVYKVSDLEFNDGVKKAITWKK